jgi:alpha-beta hydrolase superfamily lysophospholipase
VAGAVRRDEWAARAVGEAYDRDPLVSHAVSAGWARAIARAQRDVREGASRLRVKTLVMVGTDDRLVDADATRRFAAAAPRGLLDFAEWPGFRHQLLNEIGREQVIQTIIRWLNARLE